MFMSRIYLKQHKVKSKGTIDIKITPLYEKKSTLIEYVPHSRTKYLLFVVYSTLIGSASISV